MKIRIPDAVGRSFELFSPGGNISPPIFEHGCICDFLAFFGLLLVRIMQSENHKL